MPSPAETLATQLMTSLGPDFDTPVINFNDSLYAMPSKAANPLYEEVDRPVIRDLTTGIVGGDGYFDKIMASMRAHLEEEYSKGRITGDQFTKAYIELTSLAMNTALQFMTARDQGYWQAVTAQQMAQKAEVDVVTSRVGLATAKVGYASAEGQAQILEAQYVLAVLQTAGESAKYDLATSQIELVEEQKETARSQTLNTRTDGAVVAGTVGKQKELYDQQIDSYQKDAAFKVGKIFADSWLTQKTIDEGLTPPTELTNATVQTVLNRLRTSVALV